MLDNINIYITYLILLAIAVHLHLSDRHEVLRKRDYVSLLLLLIFVPAIFLIVLVRIVVLIMKG
ncbi:MAG TPA: hypothetical protein VIX58_05685 [Anaerolineae bacterium]